MGYLVELFKMTDNKYPLVSVIVPMHNAELYIKKCLESVINQTYKNLEILCIDDRSTDNTSQIVQEFAKKDSRIILKNSEGKFIGGTRNTGLKYATGEYVLFVDNDDWLLENTCEASIEKYHLYKPDLVVYYAKEFFMDKDESAKNNKSIFSITLKGLQEIDDKKRFATINTPWNKMYKKSIIDKYNIRFIEDANLEDVGFWWKYNQVIKTVYYIDEYLYMYRKHPNNTIKQANYKASLFNDSVKMMADVLDFLQNNNIAEACMPSYLLFVNYSVQDLFKRTFNKDIKYLKNVSDFIRNNETLSKLNNKFIQNMIKEDFYKIPEFGLYKPHEYIFSIKRGIDRLYLTVFGIKLKFKCYNVS